MRLIEKLKSNALILALSALVVIAPLSVTFGFLWWNQRGELRELRREIRQIVAAEEIADQAREDLAEVEAAAEDIIDTLEGGEDAPLDPGIADAFERLRDLVAHP